LFILLSHFYGFFEAKSMKKPILIQKEHIKKHIKNSSTIDLFQKKFNPFRPLVASLTNIYNFPPYPEEM